MFLLGTHALWAESLCHMKEACQTENLAFSCGVANIACFRSLNIDFFVTIVKIIVSYRFLKTFFEDVFIVYDSLPISFFVWNGFWITVVSSYISLPIKVAGRPKLDRVWLLYIKKLGSKCKIVVGRFYEIKYHLPALQNLLLDIFTKRGDYWCEPANFVCGLGAAKWDHLEHYI